MNDGHVFLSYRSTEREFAVRLRDDLEAHGVSIWMDNHGGIEGGDHWPQQIQNAVDAATGLIALITPEYFESKWCMRELQRADDREIPILPVYFKDVPNYPPIQLQGVQYVDFHDADVNAVKYDKALAALVNLINKKIVPVNEEHGVPPIPPRKRRELWPVRGGCLLAVVALVIVAFFAVPRFFDTSSQPVAGLFDQPFNLEPVTVFRPTKAELSLAVEREALRRQLDGVSSPRGLVMAPSADGQAVWGYGAASYVLFALDAGTGDLLRLGAERETLRLPETLGDNFLPSALAFDGRWLWAGDARNDRIVALDPAAPGGDPVLDQPLAGNPNAIVYRDGVLWVAQQDADRLVALAVDHADETVRPHCDTSVNLDAPYMLASGPATALWVASQGEADHVISRIEKRSCAEVARFAVPARVTALHWADDALWFTAGGTLYRLTTADDAPLVFDLPDAETVVDVLPTADGLWLVTDDDRLLYFEWEQRDYAVEIRQDAPINALMARDRQVWVAREDNTISRYLVPDYVYPDLAAVAWADATLWLIDTEGKLCSIRDGGRGCHRLDLAEEPVTMTAATDDATLWLGLANNRVLHIDLATGEILTEFAVPGLTEPAAIIAPGAELWISDLFSQIVILDPASGMQTPLDSLNVPVPTAIAYDGAAVWFADMFSGRLFTVSQDGDQLRQGRGFALPTSSETAHLLADGDTLTLITAGNAHVIAPVRGTLRRVVGIGGRVDAVAAGPDGIWLADRATGFVYGVAME
jgi:hypothetical protein